MAGTRRLLTAADRAEISTGLKAGWSAAKIARSIERVTSVFSGTESIVLAGREVYRLHYSGGRMRGV